jgi:hypothetical protein
LGIATPSKCRDFVNFSPEVTCENKSTPTIIISAVILL